MGHIPWEGSEESKFQAPMRPTRKGTGPAIDSQEMRFHTADSSSRLLPDRDNFPPPSPLFSMSTVGQLLKTKKQSELITITPERTTLEALQIMADKDIGAILVLSEGKLVGVLTEREYARRVVLQGKASRHTPVGETMNREFESVGPQTSLKHCMERMSVNHTRYLPVLNGTEVIGMISVGDVVRNIMAEQSLNIDHLQRYITGSGA